MGLSFDRKMEVHIEEEETNIKNNRIYVISSGKWKKDPLERVVLK